MNASSFILQFSFAATTNFAVSCTNNCSGSSNGVCQEKGICSCRLLRSGEDCSDIWSENKVWNHLFLAYSIYVILINIVCVVLACHQLYIILSAPKLYWAKGGLITQILILGLLGCILRIINFSIDPHRVRQILNPILDAILFEIPLILWLGAGFMLFLYWIELQQLSGMKELKGVSKLRPFLISLIALTALVILPAGIIRSIYGDSFIAAAIYHAFFIVAFLVLIIVSSVYGIRLIRVFRSLFNSTKVSKFRDFLTRLTKYLLALDFTLALTIFTLIIYFIARATENKWVYVAIHTILRTEEFSVLICTYFLIRKKRKTEGNSTNASNTNDSKPTVNQSDVDQKTQSILDVKANTSSDTIDVKLNTSIDTIDIKVNISTDAIDTKSNASIDTIEMK